MTRLNTIATLALIAAAGSLTACSGSSSPGSVAAPTPSATVVPSVVTPSPTSTLSTFDIACSQEVLLQTLKTRFEGPTSGMVIEGVNVRRCRNGYAHVFTIAKSTGSPPAALENEQLFLRFVDGQWQSVAEGTGISCEYDGDRFPELAAACLALGY